MNHDQHVKDFERCLFWEGPYAWDFYQRRRWWLYCTIQDPRIAEFYAKNPR